MNFLFGSKKNTRSIAKVLEDGRAIAAAEMDRPKYRDYAGREPLIQVRVRVEPESGSPFETVMKAGLTLSYLLLPGVNVQVTFNASKNSDVVLDDTQEAILARNPQLLRNH